MVIINGGSFSLCLAAITVVTTLYAPILIGDAVDFIVGPNDVDFAGLMGVLQKMGIVILITAVSQWLMNHINNKITYQVVKDIRIKAFEHLEVLPLRYLDSHPSGDIISRIIADIDQFSEGLLMGFTQLFTGVLTILGTLGFMFCKSLDCSGGCLCNPSVIACGKLYCKEDLYYVSTSVRN